MYVGMSGGAARDWLHVRTHTSRAQSTSGPLERALVTPHKSIQSLKSRRGDSGRRGVRRSGHGRHFPTCLAAAQAAQGYEHRAGVYITAFDRGGDAP